MNHLQNTLEATFSFVRRIHRTTYVVTGVLIVGGCTIFAVWELPQRLAVQNKQRIETSQTSKKVDTRELIELEKQNREDILKIIQSIGGLGFLLTGYFAWRNLQTAEKNRELAEDKQVTERFSKAVELLSESAKLEARIGGIYLLERIAKDSPEDHWTVMEILTAYVREKSRIQLTLDNAEQSSSSEQSTIQVFPADIQAAMTVIGRRNADNDEGKLDLRRAHLREADLRVANLSNAYLREADLSNAYLIGADLSEANLTAARLLGANLVTANLSGARLFGADLITANLIEADLTEARLLGADLSGAELGGAELSNIQWDQTTKWPEKSAFNYARNIPEALKKQLGIQ